MRTDKQIYAAKRAQRLRLGSNLEKGKKKRCKKGKSCGASCISHYKFCRVGLPWVGSDLESVVDSIQNRSTKVSSKPKSTTAKTDTRDLSKGAPGFKSMTAGRQISEREGIALEKVRNVIQLLQSSERTGVVRNYDGVVKSEDVNWLSGLGKSSKYVASGAYGAFIVVPPENLARGIARRFPNGVGIKYGRVEPIEAELLKKAGESGAAPKLIAAKFYTRVLNRGMIAMERVAGEQLRTIFDKGKMSYTDISDKYMTGIAKLHRLGISHNDAHFGNAIVQPNGKIKFVDLGLGSMKPYKVFYEVIKLLSPGFSPAAGAPPLSGPVVDRIRGNFNSIKSEVFSLRENRYTMSPEDLDREVFRLIDKIYQGV